MSSAASPKPSAAPRADALLDSPIGRLLWRYSLPSVVGMLVMSLYNVVDRVIIGQVVGPDAIAGLAITFPVMNLSAAVGVLVGVGASARISILLGARRRDRAEQVLGNALVLTLVNAAVYLSCLAYWLDDILRLFGASDATLPYARDFMQAILPGMLVMNLCFSFNNVMRASGYPLKAMVTMMIGAVLNIGLVALFVWRLGWGIRGAAIATDIAMTVSAAFVMAHFLGREPGRLVFRRGRFGLRADILGDIVSIGAAPSIVNMASCLIGILLNRALYRYGGDIAIAAAGVFITYTSMLTSVIIGLCQGLQPVLGYNYGAGRTDRLRRAYVLAAVAATAVCVAGVAGGMIVPEGIAAAFGDDAGLIAAVGHGLPLAMSAFVLVGFQIVSTTLFQSLGMAGRSIFLSLTRQVLFLIPLLLVLPRAVGLDGVWCSFAVSDVAATVVTAVLVVGLFSRQREALSRV